MSSIGNFDSISKINFDPWSCSLLSYIFSFLYIDVHNDLAHTFLIYKRSQMSDTPPPSATTISTLTVGRIPSVLGRITEVDDQTMTIYTEYGKLMHIFHVVFTDKTGSIQATMWDRTADFRNFLLGEVVEVQNVVAKICHEAFQEFSKIALNFSPSSRIGPPLGNAQQVDYISFPRASIRISRTPPSAPLCSSIDNLGTAEKRPREETNCPAGCDSPSKPFCSLTGKPHSLLCNVCMQSTAGKPFCSDNGLPHV